MRTDRNLAPSAAAAAVPWRSQKRRFPLNDVMAIGYESYTKSLSEVNHSLVSQAFFCPRYET